MPLAIDGPAVYQAVDLTTLAEVKLLLDASETDTSTDALISSLISDVSSRITTFLGFHTLVAARLEVYEMRRFKRILTLDTRPIDVAAETVTIKLSSSPDFTGTSDIDATLFSVHQPIGRIRFLDPPIREWTFAQINYTGGLGAAASNVLTDHPEIAHAATMQTKYLYQRRDSLGGNVETTGGSTSFDAGYQLQVEVKRILESHRRGGF